MKASISSLSQSYHTNVNKVIDFEKTFIPTNTPSDKLCYKLNQKEFNLRPFLKSEEIPEEFICTNCRFIINEPYQTECDHIFCLECKEKITECPVDKEKTNTFLYRKKLKKNIEELRLNCPNDSECSWEDSLKEFEKHYDECQYKLIPCDNQCGKNLKMKNLFDHKKYNCPKRLINCEYCQMEIEYGKIITHYDKECKQILKNCPNECGVKIKRSEREKHLLKCKNREIPCEICKEKVRADLMNKHFMDNLVDHFGFMMKENEKLKKKVLKLENNLSIFNAQRKLKELNYATNNNQYNTINNNNNLMNNYQENNTNSTGNNNNEEEMDDDDDCAYGNNFDTNNHSNSNKSNYYNNNNMSTNINSNSNQYMNNNDFNNINNMTFNYMNNMNNLNNLNNFNSENLQMYDSPYLVDLKMDYDTNNGEENNDKKFDEEKVDQEIKEYVEEFISKRFKNFDISRKNIGLNVENMKYITHKLKENKRIQRMILNNNKLGSNVENLKNLAIFLRENKSIKDLWLENNNLGLDSENIKYLAIGLKENKRIEWLDLSKNFLGCSVENLKILASGMKDNKSFKYLWLDENNLGSNVENIKYLAIILKDNNNINEIYLGGNNFGSNVENLKFLGMILKENNSIEGLDLTENNLGTHRDNVRNLINGLRENYKIERLDIEKNNYLVGEEKEMLIRLSQEKGISIDL